MTESDRPLEQTGDDLLYNLGVDRERFMRDEEWDRDSEEWIYLDGRYPALVIEFKIGSGVLVLAAIFALGGNLYVLFSTERETVQGGVMIPGRPDRSIPEMTEDLLHEISNKWEANRRSVVQCDNNYRNGTRLDGFRLPYFWNTKVDEIRCRNYHFELWMDIPTANAMIK